MLLALMLWVCSLLLVLVLVAPFFGLRVASIVGLGLLVFFLAGVPRNLRDPASPGKGVAMIEFLTANWLWILLGIGVLWFLFRGHGMGCGMGGHSHGSDPSRKDEADPHAGHVAGAGASHEHGAGASAAPSRRRHGCC